MATSKEEDRKRKIDQTLVNSLKPGQERWIWDAEIRQFAIRIRPRSVQYLLRRRFRGHQKVWRIGETTNLKAAVARERVIAARQMVDNGIDPEQWLREQELGYPLPAPENLALPQPEGWSFRQLLEAYLASDKRAAKRSNDDYQSALLRCPEVAARHKHPASAITAEIISDIRDELRMRVSARRTKCILDYLSGAFNWALKEPKAKVTANPVKGVNLPTSAAKTKNRWLTIDEIRLLTQALKIEPMDASIRHLLMFGLLTGQRKAAMLSATLSDVHLDDAKAAEHGPHVVLRVNKDNDEEHVVPLAPVAIALVESCREVAVDRRSQYLFPASRAARHDKNTDRPLADNAVNTAIERMVLSAERKLALKIKTEAALIAKGKVRPRDPNRRGRGIRLEPLPPPSDGILYSDNPAIRVAPFGPHDLRRTLSTNLARRRSDPRWGVVRWYVSALLDHAIGTDKSEFRSDITEDHYTMYEYVAEKRIAAETWAELLVAEAGVTEDVWRLPLEQDQRTKRERQQKVNTRSLKRQNSQQ